MRERAKDKKGFSLTELMIVCALIGVLISIAIPMYMNALRQADARKAIFNLNAIKQAVTMYYMEEPDAAVVAPDMPALDSYATISLDDGSWDYALTSIVGDDSVFPAIPYTFTATATHRLPDGSSDGSLTIDETGTINYDDWPY